LKRSRKPGTVWISLRHGKRGIRRSHILNGSCGRQSALNTLSPGIDLSNEVFQDIRDSVDTVLELHHAAVLLWRRNVFVLAVKIVLPAELARACFVAFLFSRTAMIAGLCGSDLFAPHLLAWGSVVWTHVWTRCCIRNRLSIRLSSRRRWCVKATIVRMRWTYGCTVAIGNSAIRTMLRVHGPVILVMLAMLHARRGFHVNTDAGRS